MKLIRVVSMASALACSVGAMAQVAKVEAAWARPTVAGQPVGGGYLKIAGGASADRLLSARAAVARSVEMHTMEMDGSTMRMRPLAAVPVPAGQTVEFKPGGLHLMFTGLAQPLKSGSSFPLTLRFEKAGDVTVQVKVAPQAP